METQFNFRVQRTSPIWAEGKSLKRHFNMTTNMGLFESYFKLKVFCLTQCIELIITLIEKEQMAY
jgi:hypothetical protein